MRNRLPALLFVACLLSVGVLEAKPHTTVRSVSDSTTTATGPVVQYPAVNYEHPVTKTIAEVKITGSTSYDDFVLSSLSGLQAMP